MLLNIDTRPLWVFELLLGRFELSTTIGKKVDGAIISPSIKIMVNVRQLPSKHNEVYASTLKCPDGLYWIAYRPAASLKRARHRTIRGYINKKVCIEAVLVSSGSKPERQ